jgi:hypothetical protein
MMMMEIDYAEPVSLIGRKSGKFVSKHREFFITWLMCSIIAMPIFYGCHHLYKEYGAITLIFPFMLFAFAIMAVLFQYMDDDY